MNLKGLLTLLFPPRARERIVADGKNRLCALLTPRPFPVSGFEGVALLPYADETVQAFVIESKYHGNKRAQEALGEVLADYLLERMADDESFAKKSYALVPVPLSPSRRKERGYNQVEEICLRALARLGKTLAPMPDLLSRVKDTLPQTSLSAEARRTNVREAFQASRP